MNSSRPCCSVFLPREEAKEVFQELHPKKQGEIIDGLANHATRLSNFDERYGTGRPDRAFRGVARQGGTAAYAGC